MKSGIIADLKLKFNNIGIIGDTSLCRLIGFHEDESDYYYHILYMNGHTQSDRNDQYFSMVGRFESLKGVLSEESYKRLDNTFSLNGAPHSETFIIGKD